MQVVLAALCEWLIIFFFEKETKTLVLMRSFSCKGALTLLQPSVHIHHGRVQWNCMHCSCPAYFLTKCHFLLLAWHAPIFNCFTHLHLHISVICHCRYAWAAPHLSVKFKRIWSHPLLCNKSNCRHLYSIWLWAKGKDPSTGWRAIAEHVKTKNYSHMCFWNAGRSQSTLRKPMHARGEHANSTHEGPPVHSFRPQLWGRCAHPYFTMLHAVMY